MGDTPIYEIQALERPMKVDELGIPQFGDRESMGFYYELETAKQAVINNWTDINESGAYNAAVILKKKPGLYPISIVEGYYIFNRKTEKYDESTMPKEMEHYNL